MSTRLLTESTIAPCPRCGTTQWTHRLATGDCPTCRILDSRSQR